MSEAHPSDYDLFDQQDKLGEPPWSGDPVERWEKAHGHDPRLECYVEYGCRVIAHQHERYAIAR